jgi:hypothetical protein
MLNWALRYIPTTDWLSGRGCSSILDVGSGQHGIRDFLTEPSWVVQSDLAAFKGQQEVGSSVQADCTQLPFQNKSFSAVVALDLLEHIPASLRALAVKEFARVSSRYVIVGFPEGASARASDARLRGRLKRFKLPEPPWLTEHLEGDYPDVDEFVVAAASAGLTVIKIAVNEPIWFHDLLMMAEQTRGIAKILPSLPARRLATRLGVWAARDSRPCYRRLYFCEITGWPATA